MVPEILLYAVMTLALAVYIVLGGSDFGTGAWEALVGRRDGPRGRALLAGSIGPVWEANHVWLIFLIVTLFAGFPAAFGGLFRALWLPLLIALLGIVFRGAAFAFRHYQPVRGAGQAAWRAAFAASSVTASFFIGASAGAVASGRLGVGADGSFHGDYFAGWLTPAALAAGVLSIATNLWTSSVFLAREAARAGEPALSRAWRRRALAATLAWTALILAAMTAIGSLAPDLARKFSPLTRSLACLSLGGMLATFVFLLFRRRTAAASCVFVGVIAMALSYGVSHYPMLVPPGLTVQAARAPAAVLWTMLAVIGAGAFILVPSLLGLFWLFKISRHPAPLKPRL